MVSIIEAMMLMNEILAEVSVLMERVYVEYGQPAGRVTTCGFSVRLKEETDERR